MNLRVDRIDQIDDEFAIIDYKSTTYAGVDWFGNRPDAPQLLLYLISSKLPISSIIFGQIKLGKMLYRGLAYKDVGITGVNVLEEIDDKQKWQQQKKAWQNSLANLADDFNNGVAELDPKYITTCSGCDYHMLCRINDQRVSYDN